MLLLVQGTGKQSKGALINFAAYYAGALPLASILGFWYAQGVEGLYIGLQAGPIIQVCFDDENPVPCKPCKMSSTWSQLLIQCDLHWEILNDVSPYSMTMDILE